MPTVVIINDEENALHTLIGMLGNFNSLQLNIAGSASHLEEGAKLIERQNPDIVFLDIDQPEQNLDSFYSHFKEPSFKVILVTAYLQDAITASKNYAFDYLLKPLKINDLQIILQRISQQVLIEQKTQEIDFSYQNEAAAPSGGANVIFDVENGFIFENTANIEYCKANQSNALVILHNGKEIQISKSLKQLADQFPSASFYRVHKTYLVNIYYIRRFVKAKESYVILKNGLRIPVAVRMSTHITRDIKEMIKGGSGS
jgi:two-component system, LytTR family, response regulator